MLGIQLLEIRKRVLGVQDPDTLKALEDLIYTKECLKK